MTGTLYAVGVGPGAPDLLTLRAVEALRRVDVILAAASPRNDYSRALETARPHLRPDVRLQRLEFPMTHDKATLRAAWEKAAGITRDVLRGARLPADSASAAIPVFVFGGYGFRRHLRAERCAFAERRGN